MVRYVERGWPDLVVDHKAVVCYRLKWDSSYLFLVLEVQQLISRIVSQLLDLFILFVWVAGDTLDLYNFTKEINKLSQKLKVVSLIHQKNALLHKTHCYNIGFMFN